MENRRGCARGARRAHYPTLFTYGVRGSDGRAARSRAAGASGCRRGRWSRPRSGVRRRRPRARPSAALMHWRAGGEVEWRGRHLRPQGPASSCSSPSSRRGVPGWRFVVAAGGGKVPEGRARGARAGSSSRRSRSPGPPGGTPRSCTRRAADLGVAKDAYVASRGGWFSDRSTCFLAAGRPVLHQDTGFTEWLPPARACSRSRTWTRSSSASRGSRATTPPCPRRARRSPRSTSRRARCSAGCSRRPVALKRHGSEEEECGQQTMRHPRSSSCIRSPGWPACARNGLRSRQPPPRRASRRSSPIGTSSSRTEGVGARECLVRGRGAGDLHPRTRRRLLAGRSC